MIDITKRMVNQVRNQVEEEAEKWYLELKQSRYLYLAHFKERIDTLYSVEKSLWEIANDKDNAVVDRRGALAEIHHTEKTLSGLYDISRYLTDGGIVPSESQYKTQSILRMDDTGQCDCKSAGRDRSTHCMCFYCHQKWCPTTLKQDWCPNPDCSQGIKGSEYKPWDEHNV